MIILRNTIDINVPLQRVFIFLADPENFPKWNYYLKTVKKIADGNPVIGSEYHQVRKTDEQYFAITEFKEDELIELTSIKKSKIKFKRRFTFSATENGCRVDDLFELGTWGPSFIGKLVSKKPEKAVKENLMKLKELLENSTTILQDSRLVSI